ncbi:MAG: hypothetical protein NUW23_01110 [Firmicutes bacterium]|nr:hypothetical protein [Bacillota bacterium]
MRDRVFFGLVLLIIGVVWLARNLGITLIRLGFPCIPNIFRGLYFFRVGTAHLIPVLLIVVGILLFLDATRRRG